METPNGLENLLDHLRTHFEPIEVFRQERVVDDFVCNFERQPGKEIRDYDSRFKILLRRFEAVAGQVNPLIKAHVFLRKAQTTLEAQDEEDEGEQVLEENEASEDELEAEYQEAVAKQRRAEVNRSRQFSRKPQSSEDSKARLDKLKQKLSCARCGQLGHWKDDKDCPAKGKVLNWRKPRSFQFLQSLATSLSNEREQCGNHRLIEQYSRCRGASPR